MTIKRAALLTAGPLVALGLSTALAHAEGEGEDLFPEADGYSIFDPNALTGTPVLVGGLAPLDSDYEYADQNFTLTIGDVPHDGITGDVYQATDVFGGTDTLVDLNPGQPIADSDIFDTFSIGNGALVLQHVDITTPLDGLSIGEYNSIDLFGTTFVTPEFLDSALGPDYGLQPLDIVVLTDQASSAATALDVTPFTEFLTSLF
jgi:hypothetical protein